MSYFNFLSEHTSKMTPQDMCQICFKEAVLPQTNPNAIIVLSDLFGIEGLLKATFQAADCFPDSPIIIAGDKSRFYAKVSSFFTTSLIARNFAKSTGLSRRFIFKHPENVMIKNMLSEKGWAYFNTRDKLHTSILKFSKILTVGGLNEYDSLLQTKNCLQENNLNQKHLLLIAPAHTNRNYMTAKQIFPNSEITFTPYFWNFENLSLTPQLVLQPPEILTLKQRFAIHTTQRLLQREVKQILKASQKGKLLMPQEVLQIYGKYLHTPLVSQAAMDNSLKR